MGLFFEKKEVVTDEMIIKVGEDNREAFQKLYYLTDRAIYGYALSLVTNTQDAEDIMHDTYIKIRETAHNYIAMGKPMAWILTITRNLANMKFRERTRVSPSPIEEMGIKGELSYHNNIDDRLWLESLLNSLADKEREIILLHIVAGYKHREIAGILNMPIGSVLAKYSRAIKKLQQYTVC